MEAAGYEPAARPRIVTVGTTLAPGERSWDQLVATRGRPVPARVDPESLAVLLYTSGTSGRPRAAMLSHRALLANIEQVAAGRPADDHRPRRRARGAAAVPRLRAQRRARPGAAPAGAARAGRRLRPRGLAGHHRGRGDLGAAGGAAGLRLLDAGARARGPARPGAPGAQRLRAARPRAHRGLHRADRRRDPPGLRPHRGGAGRHLDAVQREARPRARSVPPCPASRSGSSTTTAASRTTRTAARSRSAATTCSPATGPTAPTARTPTAGGRPATSATSTATGDLYLVDRVKELVIVSGFNVYPSEVEDVIAELPDVAEAAVIGVEDAADRRGGGGLRQADRGRRRATTCVDVVRRALRAPAGPVQAALGDPRRRRRCPTRRPARCRRAGCGRPSAVARWACWSERRDAARVTLYSKPGCHLCEDARGGDRAGLRRRSARRTTRSTSPARPS